MMHHISFFLKVLKIFFVNLQTNHNMLEQSEKTLWNVVNSTLSEPHGIKWGSSSQVISLNVINEELEAADSPVLTSDNNMLHLLLPALLFVQSKNNGKKLTSVTVWFYSLNLQKCDFSLICFVAVDSSPIQEARKGQIQSDIIFDGSIGWWSWDLYGFKRVNVCFCST